MFTLSPQCCGACSQSNHKQKDESFHTPTSNRHWRCHKTHHPCPLFFFWWRTLRESHPLPSCLHRSNPPSTTGVIEQTDETWNEHWVNLSEAGHYWRQHHHQDPSHSPSFTQSNLLKATLYFFGSFLDVGSTCSSELCRVVIRKKLVVS